MEQQQDPSKSSNPNLTGGHANLAPGAIRPPMPNSVRPPPPRPQMGQPAQRPPMPVGPGATQPQQSGQVRPPMPSRPPMPNNAARPPMPPRPMAPPQMNQAPRPSIPQSPNQGNILPPVAQRPPMPPQNIAAGGATVPPQRPPVISPVRPPMPSTTQTINRPPIPGQNVPLASPGGAAPRPPMPQPLQSPVRPPMPAMSQSTQTSAGPPIPGMPQPLQSSVRPPISGISQSAQTSAGPPIPGMSQPVHSPVRPPMPIAPPVMPNQNQQVPSMRPPMPTMPQRPLPQPVTSPTFQRPPVFGAPVQQQQPALRPPMPVPVASQQHSAPMTPNRPPMPIHPSHGYPQQQQTPLAGPTASRVPPMPIQPLPQTTSAPSMTPQAPAVFQTEVPQMRMAPQGPPMNPQVQVAPQMPMNPQAPGMGQIPAQTMASTFAPAATGYPPQPAASHNPSAAYQQQQPQAGYPSQHGYPQTPMPGAPQSVSSTSHNMKEFYDAYDPLIKPNIHSDYLSCSLGKIPRNASLLGKSRTPFGLTVSFYPYGDAEKDKVAEVTGQIVRCRRCRTYLNPFAELIEQGSRWRCNICYLANEFPPNYDFDPVTQKNVDRHDHVELKNFVYDFTNAPIEYTVRPPQPSVFLFALEVTSSAVQSGLFAASCRVIQEQLDAIPNDDGRARVGLITFDQRINFYKMTPNEANAKVLVVADAGEPFLPACSDLLVNLSECRSQLDALLDQLPQMYSTSSKASSALGPVLQSAHMLLKSIGGKIVVICSSLPTQFEGALKARDDSKLLGTPKESTLLQPANQFYKLFASEIVKDQICVDLFVAPPQLSAHVPMYVDLATLSGLTKYTGGKLHYYPEFGTGDAISSKFCSDLRRFLGQPHGFEAVLRIRASQGISLSAYHGSFFLRQTDLLSLPNVNPDHSFSAQASIDENLQGTVVCFQAALLHTTCKGERRIRVINFSAPVTDDVKEVFSHMNVNGIAGLLAKMAVEKILANRLEDAREAVLNKCSDVIAAFKSQYSLKTNPNLLLPENMRNFPLMLHGLIKSVALRSGSITLPDLRAYHLTLLKTLSVQEIIGLLLPRFYAIHSMDSEVKNVVNI